ncbi:MAG: substrate-binding domain-containing protein [Bacteroidota bacterium]|nr:substrate-binding domain-containing protein [Bacteroidota bacterium]
MKRANLTSIAVVLVFSLLVSCSLIEKPKIGVLFPHLQSDRNKREKEYFTQKIQELGGEAIIASAEYDDKVQISQADDMIQKGVKVIIVSSVNFNSAAAIVRNAHRHGVKVLAYDRIIKNCDLDFYISFNNVKVGELMAQYVTKLKPEGKYMLLGGDKADHNAIWIKEGQHKELDPFVKSGKIKVVYDSFLESWSAENAQSETSKYFDLSLNDAPDVILSSGDGVATGVIEALKAHGLNGKILVTGQDASLAACRNIVKGDQTLTIYKPFKGLAIKAAELGMLLAKGEKITETTTTIWNGAINVPALLFEPKLVDKNNLKSTVIADGFQSEKDVYGNN